MEKYKCSHCKNYFDRKDVMINSLSQKGIQYYWCRGCNSERARKYRKTPKGHKIFLKKAYKSIKKHQNKQNARLLLNYHIGVGHIVKPSKCEKCLEEKIVEGHHFDYTKPLEIIWVCKRCHSLIHRNGEKI